MKLIPGSILHLIYLKVLNKELRSSGLSDETDFFNLPGHRKTSAVSLLQRKYPQEKCQLL